MLKPMNVLIALSTLLSATAFAGGGIGNGGDAVICDGGKNVYLLDYVEGKGRNFSYSQSETSASVRQIVDEAFLALRKKVDFRSYRYEEMKNEVLADIEKFNGGEYLGVQVAFTNEILPDVPDSEELSLPANCTEKRQLVIQRQSSKFPQDQAKLRNFRIYSPLWAKMNNFQRAMTIMHEILFWDQIEDGALDSRNARYLNETVMADTFAELNPCTWLKALKLSEAKNYFGFGMGAFTTDLFGNGHLTPFYKFWKKYEGQQNTVAGTIVTNVAECGSDGSGAHVQMRRYLQLRSLTHPELQNSSNFEIMFLGSALIDSVGEVHVSKAVLHLKDGLALILKKTKEKIRTFSSTGGWTVFTEDSLRLNPSDSHLKVSLQTIFRTFALKAAIERDDLFAISCDNVGAALAASMIDKEFCDGVIAKAVRGADGQMTYATHSLTGKLRPRNIRPLSSETRSAFYSIDLATGLVDLEN